MSAEAVYGEANRVAPPLHLPYHNKELQDSRRDNSEWSWTDSGGEGWRRGLQTCSGYFCPFSASSWRLGWLSSS